MKWLSKFKHIQNAYCESFPMNFNSFNSLANSTMKGVFGPQFSSITDFISSAVYFPILLHTENRNKGLRVTRSVIGENAFAKSELLESVHPGNFKYNSGEIIYLTSHYYIPTTETNTFNNFEPYTKIKIFLPFYGFIEPLVRDIINKHIHFFMSIDYISGEATYYIFTSDEELFEYSIDNFNNLNNLRLVYQFAFSLGIEIPITNNGSTQIRANNLFDSIRGIMAATTLISGVNGLNTSSYTKTIRKINPKTKRLRKTEEIKKEYTGDSSFTKTFNTISSLSVNALEKMQSNVSTSSPSNNILNFSLTRSIIFVEEIANIKPKSIQYNHLFGSPLGEVHRLSTLSGYTTISKIHLEGEGFGKCTLEEMSMIEDALYQGFII